MCKCEIEVQKFAIEMQKPVRCAHTEHNCIQKKTKVKTWDRNWRNLLQKFKKFTKIKCYRNVNLLFICTVGHISSSTSVINLNQFK